MAGRRRGRAPRPAGLASWRNKGISDAEEGADKSLARYAAVNADDIVDALNPDDYKNRRRIDRKLEENRVRTEEDMTPEERRAIEKLYGVKFCGTHERAGRRRS